MKTIELTERYSGSSTGRKTVDNATADTLILMGHAIEVFANTKEGKEMAEIAKAQREAVAKKAQAEEDARIEFQEEEVALAKKEAKGATKRQTKEDKDATGLVTKEAT